MSLIAVSAAYAILLGALTLALPFTVAAALLDPEFGQSLLGSLTNVRSQLHHQQTPRSSDDG